MGPQAARPRRKLTEMQGKVVARGSESGNVEVERSLEEDYGT